MKQAFRLFLIVFITLEACNVDAFSFSSLMSDSYNDCLGSFNFVWNSKEYCNYGKELLESQFSDKTSDDFDMSFRMASPLRDSPKENDQLQLQVDEEFFSCYSSKLLLEIGKAKKTALKQKCSPAAIKFSGESDWKNKIFRFTIKCVNIGKIFMVV